MAQYKEGKATVVSGSAIVNGTGTAWLGNVQTGDCFLIQGESAIYNVNTVNGDGVLQISPPYAGSNRTDAPYAIVRDFTSLLGLPEITGRDQDWPFLVTQALRKIDAFLQRQKDSLASDPQSFAGGVETTLVSVQDGAHFGSSYAEDIGHSNPIGRLQVYSEIAPAPGTNVGYPMGNDLALLAQGPADLRLKTIAADVTCYTSVAPGTVTVRVSSTETLADPVTLLVDPDTANEEYIVDANWYVTDGTHLAATFTKSHSQPFIIRQVGGVYLDTRMLTVNGQDPADRPLVVQDRVNNHILKLPNDTGGTFPKSAVQVGAPVTGMPNLVIRNSSSSAYGEIIKSDNSGFVLVWSDDTITPVVPISQLREQQTVMDFASTLHIQADVGGMFMVAVPNANAFTISNPTGAVAGQTIKIMIQNVSSGAIGTITWGDKYRLSGPVAPAAAKVITVHFYYDGQKWWEVSRSAEVVTA